MNYPLLIFFGLAPSIVWLLFYLGKDSLPESNRDILKVFYFGMIMAVPACLIELGILREISLIPLDPFLIAILSFFVAVSSTEEIFKYLTVRMRVFLHHSFDEPVDAMIYMIVSALGFAAAENMLYLFSEQGVVDMFAASWVRFIGATFLHGLCSGTLGYFLALSFCCPEKRLKMVLTGFSTAILLHGLYDLFIMESEGIFQLAGPVVVLAVLAALVFSGFEKLKKLKSVCYLSKK